LQKLKKPGYPGFFSFYGPNEPAFAFAFAPRQVAVALIDSPLSVNAGMSPGK
jgi:hypothetical protein